MISQWRSFLFREGFLYDLALLIGRRLIINDVDIRILHKFAILQRYDATRWRILHIDLRAWYTTLTAIRGGHLQRDRVVRIRIRYAIVIGLCAAIARGATWRRFLLIGDFLEYT